ncbi:peptidase inhibitor family I36 protein [Streptomyces sp. CBMA156]|uniref:peptidase inhibitor family I36 protein n=1 Tax=Streptomyces sp. CBMA156 TaxID=1930280 RepID=UPI001661FD9B|nr:peptidase inhibitor family I36 protein [Streptomyces sp. CBMA156]
MAIVRRMLLTAAVLTATVLVAPSSSAQPLTPSASPAAAGGDLARNPSFHAFTDTHFTGADTWFSNTQGQCTYVGDNWNDKIRSARTEGGDRVELWDNFDCTGGSITIDASGYSSIGGWVSAYRAYLG